MNPNRTQLVIVILGSTLVALLFLIWHMEDDHLPGDVGWQENSERHDQPAIATDSSDKQPPDRLVLPDPDAAQHGPEFVRALSGFRGRVVRASGKPIADIEVAILRFDNEAFLGQGAGLFGKEATLPDLVAGRSNSDETGSFLITGVWPGSFYVLRAGRGGTQIASRIVPRTPGPGEVVDLGDIYVENGSAIIGRVVDESNRPIAGATVRSAPIPGHLLEAWPIERFDFESPVLYVDGDRSHVLEIPQWVRDRLTELAIATTRTDDTGSFRMTGVQPGHLAVFVTAAGRVPSAHSSTPVLAGEETDLGTVVLRHGSPVRGRVLDASGRPVSNAEVLVGQGTALIPFVFTTRADDTGPDGKFVARGFHDGRVVAAARRGPDAPWVISDQAPIDDELVLRIPSGRDLTVQLHSSSSERLSNPRFRLLSAAPDSPNVDLSLFGLRQPLRIDAKLSQLADGRYRVTNLQQGRYILLVDADAHTVRAVPFTLETDLELAVELRPQRPFVVIVTDDEGQPVAEAQVRVQTKGEFPRIPRLPISCGRTDQDGRIRVTQAISDRIAVRVTHPAHGTYEQLVELPTAFVHVKLLASGALEGKLTEGGKRPRPGRWNLAIRPSMRVAESLVELPRLASPERDGSFRVSGLTPGEYEVSIIDATDSAPLGLALDMRKFVKRLNAPDRRRTFPVHAGKTTHVDIDTDPGHGTVDGPSAIVTGSITVNGRPASGLEVRGWHKRWLSGPIGEDGRFDLGEVPTGNVGLYVIDPRTKREGRYEMLWWKQVQVEEGQPIELNVDLQLGEISGTVTHADGHRVPGCQVKLTGRSKGAGNKPVYTKFYGITGRRGAFSFANLPAGRYTATVWDRRNGRAEVQDIVVSGGVETRGVQLPLIRVVSLAGHIDLHRLGPGKPQWSWLRLYGKDEKGRYVSKERGSKIRSDGRFKVEGIPPGRYEVSIGAMYRKASRELAWETQMFVHDTVIEIGPHGLRNVELRPRPRPPKKD